MADTDPPIEVARAALLEVNRPDLADMLIWRWNDEGDGIGFLDLVDDELPNGTPVRRTDWDLVDQAEMLALSSIGFMSYRCEPNQ